MFGFSLKKIKCSLSKYFGLNIHTKSEVLAQEELVTESIEEESIKEESMKEESIKEESMKEESIKEEFIEEIVKEFIEEVVEKSFERVMRKEENITKKRIFANPLKLANDLFEYESNESLLIQKWHILSKDVHQDINTITILIAMIQQLCLFTQSLLICLRPFDLCNDDVVYFIESLRNRSQLIDTSQIDLTDATVISSIHHKMKKTLGLFKIKNFLIRVEPAFDNGQIKGERYVVSQLIKHHHPVGIDNNKHVIIPYCIQIKNIEAIPYDKRTIYHNISYSIQPYLYNSSTIDSWFKKNKPSCKSLLNLCFQMATALCHLHSCDIVHGDIKPGNTLISTSQSNTNILHLIDFGMSGNNTTGTGGTKPFCAPETGNGNVNCNYEKPYTWSPITKENDMWSFGLMFFTMFALNKCYYNTMQYPFDFFDTDGYVNDYMFCKITNPSISQLFKHTLCKSHDRITSSNFVKEIQVILNTLIESEP